MEGWKRHTLSTAIICNLKAPLAAAPYLSTTHWLVSAASAAAPPAGAGAQVVVYSDLGVVARRGRRRRCTRRARLSPCRRPLLATCGALVRQPSVGACRPTAPSLCAAGQLAGRKRCAGSSCRRLRRCSAVCAFGSGCGTTSWAASVMCLVCGWGTPPVQRQPRQAAWAAATTRCCCSTGSSGTSTLPRKSSRCR